ncbi:hypothetical protein GQ55_9G482800 [Panicum hallii var. hallii]|uniref:Uncharacterized protein n=1 Tax=Panicum hallii var. hallii TaxID=1504633 RepID=A0A2T7CCV4_9POAL|nr:hypothetical protein GQ55_9G482800 [Panicum hallii var. hallii]
MARVLSFVEFGRRCPSSPDYSPLTVAPSPRAASPEYTPVSLLWRAGTPEYAPSTALRLGPPVSPPPLRGAAFPDYSPSSSPSRPASPEYTPLGRRGWWVGSPDHAPSSTSTASHAASPDYAPSSTPTTYRVASPEYTPVSRLWRAAGSPDYWPSHPPPGAESPYCVPAGPPRAPPARAPPPPSPARRYRRRHHPYQRSGADNCTWSASGINHGQRHLVF